MKQFKININDLFEKSEVETMMDDVEKSSIIYEMIIFLINLFII